MPRDGGWCMMTIMNAPSPDVAASLVVALIALFVAILALVHELARNHTQGVTARIIPVLGERCVVGDPHARTTGTVAWNISFEVTGSTPMLMVSAAIWDREGHRVSVDLPEERPIWSTGDEPITFRVHRKHDGRGLDNLAVGLIWARPQPFRVGILDHAVRWQLKPNVRQRDGRYRARDVERWSYLCRRWRSPNRFERWFVRWWYSRGWQADLKARGAQREPDFGDLPWT